MSPENVEVIRRMWQLYAEGLDQGKPALGRCVCPSPGGARDARRGAASSRSADCHRRVLPGVNQALEPMHAGSKSGHLACISLVDELADEEARYGALGYRCEAKDRVQRGTHPPP
jgi:hypothetical protein